MKQDTTQEKRPNRWEQMTEQLTLLTYEVK